MGLGLNFSPIRGMRYTSILFSFPDIRPEQTYRYSRITAICSVDHGAFSRNLHSNSRGHRRLNPMGRMDTEVGILVVPLYDAYPVLAVHRHPFQAPMDGSGTNACTPYSVSARGYNRDYWHFAVLKACTIAIPHRLNPWCCLQLSSNDDRNLPMVPRHLRLEGPYLLRRCLVQSKH